MRLLLTLLGCSMTLIGLAQTPRQTLRIQVSYERAGRYLEQAVEGIEAVNTVEATTNVEYKAGRSVTLLPGFQAKTGGTFTARIEAVKGQDDNVLRLTAYPNPFEHSTTIEYNLPADGTVNVWITDSQGKIVGKLVQEETQSAGKHAIEWKPEFTNVGTFIPMVEVNKQRAASRVIKK